MNLWITPTGEVINVEEGGHEAFLYERGMNPSRVELIWAKVSDGRICSFVESYTPEQIQALKRLGFEDWLLERNLI